MSLIEFFDGVEPLGIIIFSSVILGLILVFVLIIYINIASPFFTKRFDPLLFNTRWFTVSELGIYTVWPFSLMRTFIYMGLIAAPWYVLKTKRFKGFDLKLNVSTPLKITSALFVFLILLTLLCGLIFAFVGGYVYFFYEAPTN